MRASLYDQILIKLTWIGPLAFLLLSRWQISLEQWYVPLNGTEVTRMSDALPMDLKPWLQSLGNTSGRHAYLIVDPDCPCTEPAISKVKSVADSSPASSIALQVFSIHDPKWKNDDMWRQVLSNIPSTPTLITAEDNQLLYAGPAVSGSLCSGNAKTPGLTGQWASVTSVTANFLDWGCFCRTHRE